MERVLSQDERIRRAEELYERRKNQKENRISTTVNIDNRGNKVTKKLILQFITCLILYTIFYAIKISPNILSKDIMYKISDILEYDININEIYNSIYKYNYKKDEYMEPQNENNEEKNEQLIEDTLAISDNSSNEEKIVEETLLQDSSSITQMDVDAEFIKQNYSIIKPLTGEITSRFGLRNPTVQTVPKYHTGIDIARVTGAVIVAAMDGTVELVSSQGDYGNHIKITQGEVSTLYAHCSKIYVTEGEQISQGQEIAEVGATGNVTGPHLHFEIRRNNQYVDPDLILQF